MDEAQSAEPIRSTCIGCNANARIVYLLAIRNCLREREWNLRPSALHQRRAPSQLPLSAPISTLRRFRTTPGSSPRTSRPPPIDDHPIHPPIRRRVYGVHPPKGYLVFRLTPNVDTDVRGNLAARPPLFARACVHFRSAARQQPEEAPAVPRTSDSRAGSLGDLFVLRRTILPCSGTSICFSYAKIVGAFPRALDGYAASAAGRIKFVSTMIRAKGRLRGVVFGTRVCAICPETIIHNSIIFKSVR